jgi:type IV pilus assembly protein PilC
MPEFLYRGVDRGGKRVEGKLDVANEGELRMALRTQGVRPTNVRRAGAGSVGSNLLSTLQGKKAPKNGVVNVSSVPVQIIVLFTRQMQLLISSGIPLVQALDMLADQTTHSGMRAVVGAIKEKVAGGSYLWESMSAYPGVFPNLYVALMRAGESSGAMDSMLKRLSKYLEDEDRLKRMIKSAMMYPAIVTLIGIGVISLMLIFVIPKFEDMLKSGGQELPGPTQLVISMSHGLQSHFLLISGSVVGLWFVCKKFFATPDGRALKDRFVFKSPIFGVLAQKSGIARFSRTLQTLLMAGVNLIDAIDICRRAADNAVLEDAIGKIRVDIEGGKTLGTVLMKLTVFPKMASQMIMVGESTGNLDKSLEKIADFYESDVEVLVGGMTKMIEPIVLVVLGGAVGGMLVAMYLPIFKMAGGIN